MKLGAHSNMKGTGQCLITGVILLITAHPLPAPISEIEQKSTPAAEQSSKPKEKDKDAENNFLKNCPLKKGDPLSKVKEFYRVGYDPEKSERPPPGGTSYTYHFSEYGVWIFLSSSQQVQTLRFDKPFAAKIDGVAVGDTKEMVITLKGEPLRKFQGLPDLEVSENRKKRIAEIIENLPDRSPKELVRKAFSDIEALHALPLSWNEAWVYSKAEGELRRYDFGSLSGKVQTILSDHGT
jgi:hypothetical protein